MSRKTYQPLEESAKEVLDFIRTFFIENNVSPTYDEIKNALGMSTKSLASRIINYLIDEGKLEKEDRKFRGLRLPDWQPSGNQVSIHLKGYIAASNTNPSIILEEFDAESLVEVPTSLLPQNTPLTEFYALTVQGDSMEDALIGDGDTIILKHANNWQDGRTYAIWLAVDEALTLKKLYRNPNHTARLIPKSNKHKIRIEDEGDIDVQGEVIAVMRKYGNH